MSFELPASIQAALAASASPDRATVNFERLLNSVTDRSDVLSELAGDPHTVETLVAVLSSSQFLTEILLRNPGYLALLAAHSGLAQIKSAGWLRAGARTATDPFLTGEDGDRDAALDGLRRYQQRELLRIGAADLAGLVELASVTSQLSRLADAVVQTTLEIVAGRLDIAPEGFVVIAMGKLGGGELNYSSDIDLVFVSNGEEAEPGDEARAGPLAQVGRAAHGRARPAPPWKASSTGSTCACAPGVGSVRWSRTGGAT